MSVMVVWLDPEHARLFLFSEEKMERNVVRAPSPGDFITDEYVTDGNWGGLENGEAEVQYFEEICGQLLPVKGILLMGPGDEKDRFQNYIRVRYPLMSRKIVGCENVEVPSDPQIASIASRYLRSGKAASN